MQRLESDLKALPERRSSQSTVAGELYLAWRQRVRQAITALGYLKRISDQTAAPGGVPLSAQSGLNILEGMSSWGDVLADEVLWLIAAEWWELYAFVAQQTPSNANARDSVYSANPQAIAEQQRWIHANSALGEKIVRRFMK